jgi:hypothetical protein
VTPLMLSVGQHRDYGDEGECLSRADPLNVGIAAFHFLSQPTLIPR